MQLNKSKLVGRNDNFRNMWRSAGLLNVRGKVVVDNAILFALNYFRHIFHSLVSYHLLSFQCSFINLMTWWQQFFTITLFISPQVFFLWLAHFFCSLCRLAQSRVIVITMLARGIIDYTAIRLFYGDMMCWWFKISQWSDAMIL